VARCTVERLMRELGIRGVSPGRKRPPTTLPGDPADRPSDLLERCFDAAAPNRRWVADITYVRTFSGWVYTAFVMDLFARRILGWQVTDHLRADLALDALEMAVWSRRDEDLGGLSIIPTAAFNIRLSVTRSGFQKRGLSGRSGVKVTHMTMLPRRR
jgi:putative transposase